MTKYAEQEMDMDAIEPGTSATRGSSRSGTKRVPRMVVGLLAGDALTVGLAACASEVEPRGDVVSGPARGGAIEIVMKDSAFDPPRLELLTTYRCTMHDGMEGIIEGV